MDARLTRIGAALWALLLVNAAAADTYTPLTSYEPSETTLTVSAGDAGLVVARVTGGVAGAPPATDGSYVLKLSFTGEDGKVEYRHFWSGTAYDLDGEEELLADVYISTSSALPSLIGIWSPNWNPPDAWQVATGLPGATGVWKTVSFNVSTRTQTGLDQIWAFVFEGMPGANGTIYVDNLRFRRPTAVPTPTNLGIVAFADHNLLAWNPSSDSGTQGYHVYRSASAGGPFTRLTTAPHPEPTYTDPVGPGTGRSYYYATAVIDGQETAPSTVASAEYNGLTDEELLDALQQATFSYFWDFAHPVSGLTREGLLHGYDICATGGTGMGLMCIVVGADRGFVTRPAAADRVLQMLTFLDETAIRYHGAWSHWINGTTGATIPFGVAEDNGADLVETSYLAQGLLTVRQYFDGPDPVETEIRTRATDLWEGIEWDWYRRYPSSQVLYWHWSPDYGWTMDLPIHGYSETMIAYLLAIASPTHPMPATSFYNGWAALGSYANPNTYYGYRQWVGPPLGGPLFFTHYSFLGFDPRYKRDAYCNYFDNARNTSLIHRAYAQHNPEGHVGYNALAWGLTASSNPWGYDAHSPTNDNGTIAPTSAISAMPFTPDESLVTLRYFFDAYTSGLVGPYGFRDAFHPGLNWYSDTYLAIDQGPIVVMIENYRTGLCWKLFMRNPEIKPMLRAIGWTYEGDVNDDGFVDADDQSLFSDCFSGPGNSAVPGGCTANRFSECDLDDDDDVDLADWGIFARLVDGL